MSDKELREQFIKYFDDDKVYSSGQLPKENIFRSK